MRDIKYYEGLYGITSSGKVWSYRANKFLKPRKDKKGYLRVNLCKDGEKRTYSVHRLVAETYLPNPNNLPQVNHIDEDKTNNALSNLQWISPKDNNNFGTRNERIAKSLSKKVICVETQEVFDSITKAAKAVNRSTGNISDCLAGRYKTSGGFHWKYYDQKEEE